MDTDPEEPQLARKPFQVLLSRRERLKLAWLAERDSRTRGDMVRRLIEQRYAEAQREEARREGPSR